MASVNNYRGGDTNERLFLTSATSYPIEKGDLVYVHPADHTLRSASQLSNNNSVALNQLTLGKYFAGVALQKAGLVSGEKSYRSVTDPKAIRVATTGLFEFACPSQQWQVGDPVGIYCTGTAAIADSQKVTAADTTGSVQWERAVGKAVPGYDGLSNAMTRITVDITGRMTNVGIPAVGNYTNASGQ